MLDVCVFMVFLRNDANRLLVKRYREYQGLAGMPHHRELAIYDSACKDPRKDGTKNIRTDSVSYFTEWQVTVITIQITKRRWLDDQQFERSGPSI
jgi:hypothetical protein